jgi:hypothetical protein
MLPEASSFIAGDVVDSARRKSVRICPVRLLAAVAKKIMRAILPGINRAVTGINMCMKVFQPISVYAKSEVCTSIGLMTIEVK